MRGFVIDNFGGGRDGSVVLLLCLCDRFSGTVVGLFL